MPPKEVAELLGVSPSGLRRLATLYEGLYGPLPRDGSGSRLWSQSVVERMEAARALVARGRAKSIQDALNAIEQGDTLPSEGLAPRATQGEALGVLVDEVRAMRSELRELREANALMQRQLEAPPEQSAELEEQRRMNSYLMGELRRRSETDQPPHRGFWSRVFSRR